MRTCPPRNRPYYRIGTHTEADCWFHILSAAAVYFAVTGGNWRYWAREIEPFFAALPY